MIEFTSPDLEQLARDLVSAPERVRGELARVVKRGAQNIKTAAQQAAPDPHGRRLYVNSITYDLSDQGLSAEVGPDKDRPQGALGNLLEFGGAKGGAQPHLMPAFDSEEPRFVGAVEDAAGRLL